MNSEEYSLVRKTEIKRNPDWPELDLDYIRSVFNGNINNYEYKMIMNTCKTNDMAIKAIKNKRNSDKDYNDMFSDNRKERRRERYRRRKYQDIEEDNEKKYY